MQFLIVIVLSFLAFGAAVFGLIHTLKIRNLTEKKVRDLEEELSRTRTLLRNRGQLAGEIAHEIKNPLTAIHCSAEALELLIGNTLEEGQRKCLHYIKDYSEYLLRIIGDFLDLNRLESGAFDAVPEDIKVHSVIESVLGLLHASAQRKEIDIRYFVTQDDLTVWIDPKHLRQILFNLLHNAVKFTPNGGEIRVVALSDAASGRVKLLICDNGPGLSKEACSEMFEPYWRGKSDESAGAGLGLSLVKSLVETASGTIEVRSGPGAGTVFEIALPTHSTDFETQIFEEPSIYQPLLGQSFLIVDPDYGAREAIASLIAMWGGVVSHVAEAADAVKVLESANFDAVVADATGDAALNDVKILRHELRGRDTSLIVTSLDNEDGGIRAHEAGADNFLPKPLDGKRLLNTLLHSGSYRVEH